MNKGLNASQLKRVAVIAMVIDHIAPLFVYSGMPGWLMNVVGVMNVIGRLTMPIMCFFIAEGFYHTRDVKGYLLRMAVFAVISQIPYYLNHMDAMPESLWDFIKDNLTGLNVIYTLFMGLLALCVAKSKRLNVVFKVIVCAGCVFLTRYSDWRYFGVLWILAFGLFRGSFDKQSIGFALLALIRVARMSGSLRTLLIQSSVVLAIPLLALYNGEKGTQSKYGFYIFYPAHLLVIWVISILI